MLFAIGNENKYNSKYIYIYSKYIYIYLELIFKIIFDKLFLFLVLN